MAKNAQQRIAINTLKDGVGRQAPSKRLPTEAEDLTNVLVTLENSAEKRPGTTNIPTLLADGGTDRTVNGDLDLPSGRDLLHYWFDLTPDVAYLITIDYTGSGVSDDPIIYVHGMRHATVDGENPTFFKVVTRQANADQDLTDYIRYGNDQFTAKEALRIIALGPSIIILNTKVATGYTSGPENTTIGADGLPNGKTIGFDGLPTATEDVIGSQEDYLTSVFVDPEGTAEFYVANKAYAGGAEAYVVAGSTQNIYKAKKAMTATENTAITDTALWEDTGRNTARISVQDFRYPDSSKAYLGQSVNDISEIKLPPLATDDTAENGAEAMLAALYPDELGPNQNGRGPSDGGAGKIYYIANGYGGSEPGYYIVRSTTEKPYLMPIRTPDAYSVIDQKRMPVVLQASSGGTAWDLTRDTYAPRTSGSTDVNPGPTAWKDGRQTPLTSMALFRNRLFFAADDTVFSSRLNKFGEYFLEDPTLIVDTDPIDISLSSNKYTPISTLTPFESFMFINTTADIQFSLQGSENQITPLTAEISSASFYSTAPLTEPILMGSQIYFFDRRRMYVFFNDRQISIQRAIEVSQHCPNYLPTTYGAQATSPAYDTVMMADGSKESDVYMYTNRYRGDKVVQNAFFKYSFSHDIKSFYPREDRVYMLATDGDKYFVQQMVVQEETANKLYLDDVDLITLDSSNQTFDPESNTTDIVFTGVVDHSNDRLMVDYGQGTEYDGSELTVTNKVYDAVAGTLTLTVLDQWPDGLVLSYGSTYEMKVVLSEQFVRDEQNNVVDGVLSLRTMHTRHHNSGGYRVDKTIRGRKSTSVNYDPAELGDLVLDVTTPVERTGETVAKIFGFSDETQIEIVSESPNPVNITQIMLKGVFRDTYSSFVR